MKKKLIRLRDKMLLCKRSIIEIINDELKNIAHVVHSRHRGLANFLMNIKSGTDGKSNSRGIGLRLTYVLFRSKPFSIDAKRGNKNIYAKNKVEYPFFTSSTVNIQDDKV